jgi:CubicO group peptidase (beta-lactamase class C family)
VTDATLFDCASTSKSFTAAAIALLVDDDARFPEVKWDTPVWRLLPDDFVMSSEIYAHELTVEDILSHRTGCPDHEQSLMGETAANPDTPKTVTRNLRNLSTNKPLRTTYQYSNIMYTVASHLIEALTGTSFKSFLATQLWGPLDMKNTYFQVHSVEEHNHQDRLSKGYRWDEKKEEFVEVQWWRQHEGQGAGSIFSCVSDYAKWVRCMMHQSLPLSTNSHKELIQPRVIVNPDREIQSDDEKLFSHTFYALVWEVQNYRAHSLIGHDGSVSGYESKMFYLPHWDWGIVVFGNSSGVGEVAEILCLTLIDDVLGIPLRDKADWSRIIEERGSKAREEEERNENSLWSIDPKNRLPLRLPLLEFAELYHHPGYHTMTLVAQDNRLAADCNDRSLPFELYLSHVSDTRFNVQFHLEWDDYSVILKAQFQLRDDGKAVTRFGTDLSEDMAGELIWFVKRANEII